MALTNPSAEDALQLFKDIEEHFPTQTLGEERWYILAVSSAKSPTTTRSATYSKPMIRYQP